LLHKVNKRVALDISGRKLSATRASLAEPTYRKWVEDNRAYVAKASSGRLGYVHIRDMSEKRAQAALPRPRFRESSKMASSSTSATTMAAS